METTLDTPQLSEQEVTALVDELTREATTLLAEMQTSTTALTVAVNALEKDVRALESLTESTNKSIQSMEVQADAEFEAAVLPSIIEKIQTGSITAEDLAKLESEERKT